MNILRKLFLTTLFTTLLGSPFYTLAENKQEARITKLEQQQQAHEAKVDVQVEKIRNEVQSAKDSLETARKSLEWWISSLGLAAAGLGVVVALFPIFWTRQERQRLREELESARRVVAEMDRDKRDIQEKLSEARNLAKEAEERVSHIRDHEQQAQNLLANIARADAPKAEIDESRKELQKDASEAAKLAERALAAGANKDWQKAALLWEALTELQPDNDLAWFNLGYTRDEVFRHTSTQVTGQQWQSICDAYAKAIQLNNSDFIAWSNWGATLGRWGYNLEGEDAYAKFAEACTKCAEATRLQPDFEPAWYNWGLALSHWGLALKEDSAAPAKFSEACTKYAESARLEPGHEPTWRGWGNASIHLAHALIGEERTQKLLEARQYCLTAESLKPGEDAYNLACIAAMLGESDSAKDWLKMARLHGKLPNTNYLQTDRDLESLRELDWFKVLLAELDQEPNSKP